MAIEISAVPPALRLIHGKPELVEAQVNALLEDYTALSYSFMVVGAELHAAAILVHSREIRKAQLAAARMGRVQ